MRDIEQIAKILEADYNAKLIAYKKRLKNALKIEYIDFKSADNMPMSLELGDNMREQIKTIFKTLKKFDIDFE